MSELKVQDCDATLKAGMPSIPTLVSWVRLRRSWPFRCFRPDARVLSPASAIDMKLGRMVTANGHLVVVRRYPY